MTTRRISHWSECHPDWVLMVIGFGYGGVLTICSSLFTSADTPSQLPGVHPEPEVPDVLDPVVEPEEFAVLPAALLAVPVEPTDWVSPAALPAEEPELPVELGALAPEVAPEELTLA